ncbi:leucine transcriptional activator [Yersinia massiliensis]|uniref:LysR family transcriptional regulator n=1 Tax=Yersinia massiliensis TaxID=419257 RepID=UPI0005E232B9|nr:LysR family transcriptional regulator [Yersinia massiliensis]CNI01393.1 leucine transcriptional activator [Yersinia massiliensis]
MDTKKLDLNLLVTLEALLTELNVTKAAARLHLSQPAVSAQLNRLRTLFDDPLLVPARRGMIPTAKALELLAPLRGSLDQLRHTLQAHNDFHPERATLTVNIACTDYIQAVVVMPLVLALRQKAPGVRIAVHHFDPTQVEHQLATGKIDIVIATPTTGNVHLRTHHLFDESYVLIGRRGHPSLTNNLTMESYAKLEHVIVSPAGGSFSTPTDDMLAVFGHHRKVVLSATSFLFIPDIISGSEMVALVPRRLICKESARFSVFDIPWLAEQFEVSLVWHERNHSHAGQRWIRETVIALND